MNLNDRKELYRQVGVQRDSKVISYVTGTRLGAESQISNDCIDYFVEVLDDVGPTKRISMILHTNGGDVAAAWQLVNLIKMYCDEFEVLVPNRAKSAGTLISLGADRIFLTKQGVLGPIDPSFTNPLAQCLSLLFY